MKWYIMLGSLLLLFNHSVLSGSLWPPGRQYARLPCLSLSPGVCIDSMMPSNHPSSVTPFSSCPQSFPASGSFPMSQLFKSGGQSTWTSATALPMSIQGWFSLGCTSLISLLSKGLSRVFSSTTIWKHPFFGAQPSLWFNSHIRIWLLEKP